MKLPHQAAFPAGCVILVNDTLFGCTIEFVNCALDLFFAGPALDCLTGIPHSRASSSAYRPVAQSFALIAANSLD
jgi:hypothetical protein